MRSRVIGGAAAMAAVCVLAGGGGRAQSGCELVVDKAGRGTHATIQAAIDDLPAAGPCTMTVNAGAYHEAIAIRDRNPGASGDAQRVVIKTVGKVDVGGSSDAGITIASSRFITVQGFTISGGRLAGILVAGGAEANRDITIDANDIHNNGTAGGDGVVVGGDNVRTWVVNNLVRGNTRNGISVETSAHEDARSYLVNNTVIGNGWNGIYAGRGAGVYVINALVVGNGLDEGAAGGRAGVLREKGPGGASITLLHNVFYRNGVRAAAGAGADIGNAAQTLDPSDAGNLTSARMQAAGIAGCTFDACSAAPGVSAIFETSELGPRFALASRSPAIGAGLASFVHDATEWVPTVDADGRPRSVRGASDASTRVDAGYLQHGR